MVMGALAFAMRASFHEDPSSRKRDRQTSFLNNLQKLESNDKLNVPIK
jgi:hypothetical protein